MIPQTTQLPMTISSKSVVLCLATPIQNEPQGSAILSPVYQPSLGKYHRVIVKITFPQQPPKGKMKHPKLLYYIMIHRFFVVVEQRVTSENLKNRQNLECTRTTDQSQPEYQGRKEEKPKSYIQQVFPLYRSYKNNTPAPDAEQQRHIDEDQQGKEWKEKKAVFTRPLWNPRTEVEGNPEEGGSREHMWGCRWECRKSGSERFSRIAGNNINVCIVGVKSC